MRAFALIVAVCFVLCPPAAAQDAPKTTAPIPESLRAAKTLALVVEQDLGPGVDRVLDVAKMIAPLLETAGLSLLEEQDPANADLTLRVVLDGWAVWARYSGHRKRRYTGARLAVEYSITAGGQVLLHRSKEESIKPATVVNVFEGQSPNQAPFGTVFYRSPLLPDLLEFLCRLRGDAPELVSAALESRDVHVRNAAARLLAREDSPVAAAAATAPEVVSALIRVLATPRELSGMDDTLLLRALARGRDPRAPDILLKWAADASAATRAAALEGLALYGDSRGLAFLEKWLTDPARSRRTVAIEGLLLYDDPRAVGAWTDADAKTRLAVLDALGDNPSQGSADALVKLARIATARKAAALKKGESQYEAVKQWGFARTFALRFLARMPSLVQLPTLLELAQVDEDTVTPMAAAVKAGADPSPLIRALTGNDDYAATSAASALGWAKVREAVPALIQCLRSKNRWVRLRAGQALWRITGENFGEKRRKWARWWKKNRNSSAPP